MDNSQIEVTTLLDILNQYLLIQNTDAYCYDFINEVSSLLKSFNTPDITEAIKNCKGDYMVFFLESNINTLNSFINDDTQTSSFFNQLQQHTINFITSLQKYCDSMTYEEVELAPDIVANLKNQILNDIS
ncbi:Uncharacterized protein QTN25_004921 [Entamoeba marina]